MNSSRTFNYFLLMKSCAQLIRANKPIGTYLLLWPALSALFLATNGFPTWRLLIIFCIGAWLARSGGCAINDFWDRNLDQHVDRTKERPLAKGLLKPHQAIIITLILFLCAAILALQLNRLSWIVAIIAAILTTLYPLAKRVTHFPQLLLGITFNSGIIIAFTAIQNTIPSYAWLFYIANVLFTLAYDTAYAIVDQKDDINIGIGSTAILMGKHAAHLIMAADLIAFSILLYLGFKINLGSAYFVLLLLASFVCFWLHIQHGQQQSQTSAFSIFTNHHIILLLIFIGIVLSTSL